MFTGRFLLPRFSFVYELEISLICFALVCRNSGDRASHDDANKSRRANTEGKSIKWWCHVLQFSHWLCCWRGLTFSFWYFAYSEVGDSPFCACFLLSRWFMLVLLFQVAALLRRDGFWNQSSVAVKLWGFLILKSQY